MYTAVEWIFRSGNAERREAMQRIVDRSDAKPGRKRRPQMCGFLVEISITTARRSASGKEEYDGSDFRDDGDADGGGRTERLGDRHAAPGHGAQGPHRPGQAVPL